ncbi:hypothetical protein B7P43_G16565 [Cryptotermes secundus]|uniref:Uncharacterized protein n=1 Tax=Cryptotermes secundus TaxID=105785 RepID=A0A2J7REQ9_9NEOP|nr:hypothetical protein B7P43_G16565 [Cryptotermes secundus]
MEQLEVLKSEIQSAQLINKILLEEINRTGSVYSIAEKVPTYEAPKSQSETYLINKSETPNKKPKNPKKFGENKAVRVKHQIRAINQQTSKSNLQTSKDIIERPIPTI